MHFSRPGKPVDNAFIESFDGRLRWITADPMHQRRLFVKAVREDHVPVTKLCELFQISRKTGYKWLARYYEAGFSALEERSRRPHSNSRGVPDDVARRLEWLREEHPTWGARKLIAWLDWREPHRDLPAASTGTALLKRRGSVRARRVRHRQPLRTVARGVARALARRVRVRIALRVRNRRRGGARPGGDDVEVARGSALRA